MIEQVPLARGTWQLIEQAKAREAALSQVRDVMSKATGSARDASSAVSVTVNARGTLLDLRLAPHAVEFGERLGHVIVEVAKVAQRSAVQTSYNKVALLLGDELTYAIEQLSGLPAPARAADDDTGLTVEEFQRRREERLRAGGAPEPQVTDAGDDDDWASFDPSTLRSDR